MNDQRHNPGDKYWRSLAEERDDAAYREFLHREFPAAASEWTDELSRRHFLKIMGASVALAGFGGCTKQPVEKIVPYVTQPPELTPGKPLYFATAATLSGYATGVIATSREGRPIKIEGNPGHPVSLGGTSVFAQAGLLDLYDPDRARKILRAGEPSDWPDFLSAMNTEMTAQKQKQGAGLRILTGTVTSPTLYSQLQGLLAEYPAAKWCQWEPLTLDNVREGARAGFADVIDTQYRFENADVVLALDSDFLFSHPAALLYTRKFAERRRVGADAGKLMNRLYAVEPTSTITGAMADHRFPAAAGDIAAIAGALAARLGVGGPPGGYPQAPEWIGAVADDLQKSRGKSIVIAGEQQPPVVHMLVHAINRALGNMGFTMFYTIPADPAPIRQADSLKQLVVDLKSGAADMLVMLGGNPVFDAPADVDFAGALQKLKMCVQLCAAENETSRFCHWFIPAAHELESWGDARSFDGTISIIQPLIEPLYGGRTPIEVIESLMRQPVRQPYEIVHDYWKTQNLPDFEKSWRKALSDGFIAGTAHRRFPIVFIAAPPLIAPKPQYQNLELVFRPDPAIWDGRFVNNGWLQELPKPFTKLTWDNAALISPSLAAREKLENGDMVELQFRERALEVPVLITPGQAENSVTLHLGYGRQRTGRVGTGAGFNAYALRPSNALWFGDGLAIRKTGKSHPLATTQTHFNTEGRDIIREGTFAEFKANPHFIDAQGESRPDSKETLNKPGESNNEGYKWGMSIDLNTCIGCNACMIACQAENNIPVVGKYQVANARHMHWIRVDAYYKGSPDQPEITHQPVPCMQCEHAPCEPACPVGATMHDDEGLNVQVYNRCIGARYCSNNCPYKVRRFNFLEFNAGLSAVEKMVKNPDVTVRSRGVMEKCTYCTQRINAARITAELAGRRIADSAVATACQAACPAEAIVFGNLNNPTSAVSRLKAQPLDYWMLGELNTRPRTSYLAKLRNPNPEVKQ